MRIRLLAVVLCFFAGCGACAGKKPPAPETPPANLAEVGLVLDSPAEGAAVTGRWVTVSGWVDPNVVKFVGVAGAPVTDFYLPTGHVGIPTVHVIQRPNGRFIAPRVPVQEGETTLTVFAFAAGGVSLQPIVRKVTGSSVDTWPATVVADPPQSTPGKSVKFRASTGDGKDHTWQWDFDGDGVFDDESTAPSHTFANPGRFAVIARTKDGEGYVYGLTAYTVGKEPTVLLSTNEVVRPTRLSVFTNGPVGFAEAKLPDFVAAVDGEAVRVFDGSLKSLFVISGLSAPKDVEFDEKGRLYVFESGADRISRYLSDGRLDLDFASGGHLSPPTPGGFTGGVDIDLDYMSVGVLLPDNRTVGWVSKGAAVDPAFSMRDAGASDYQNKTSCPALNGGTFVRFSIADGRVCVSGDVLSRPGVQFVDVAGGRGGANGDLWALDDGGSVHLYRFFGTHYIGKWTLEFPVTAVAVGTDDRLYVAGQGRIEVRDLPRTRPTQGAYPEDGP